jgi:hypothetical protein
MDSKLGPIAQKICEKFWQKIDSNCVGSSDTQLGSFLAPEWSKRGNRIVGNRFDLSHILQKRDSCRRQTRLAANAIEERYSQALLQGPNLRSYGRLGQVKLLGSSAIIQQIRDNAEHLQFEVLDHGVAPV